MRPLALLVVVLLAACAGDGPADRADLDGSTADAGDEADAGTGLADAGDADAGTADAGADAGPDAGPDAGVDAGPPPLLPGCVQGTFTAYRGNFHSHTSYSDGEQKPADAFHHARTVAHLDLLAVTDHHEQIGIPVLSDFKSRYEHCRQEADAADAPGSFVAICGFEYGSGFDDLFRSTGHANVFFSEDLFPTIQRDYHDWYATLAGCATCLGQFNHPGDEAEQHFDEYDYDAAAAAKLRLFEFNGGGPAWDLWLTALEKGWRVAPAYNQDNHSANWGTADNGRTGFWMASLDRAALHEAMDGRRSFMSRRDADASLRLMADGACWMGSILRGTRPIALSARAADPNDGFAKLELWGAGKTLLKTQECAGALACEAEFTYSGTYAFARAIQADGDVLVSAPVWRE